MQDTNIEWTGMRLGFHSATDEGNAVVFLTDSEHELYFTLIGCGDNDQQTAIARRIVETFNAAAPKG